MASNGPRLFRKKGSRYLWADTYKDGRRIRFSTGETDRMAALDAVRERIRGISSDSLTLAEALRLREGDLRADLRLGKLRRRTVQGRETLQKALLAGLGGCTPAVEITPEGVKSFLTSKSWSNGYRHRLVRELRATLRLAYKRKRITEPVHEALAGIIEPDDPKVDTLTRDEIEALIGAVRQEWLRRFLILADATGARLGELLHATCSEVELNEEAATIRVAADRAKTRRTRYIHVQGKRALQALKDQLTEPGDFLFTGPHGTPYTDSRVQDLVQKALKQIGAYRPGRGLHSLRRSLVSDMVRAGVPIEHAAAICGHTNLQTTRSHYVSYGAIEPAALKSLAKVRR